MQKVQATIAANGRCTSCGTKKRGDVYLEEDQLHVTYASGRPEEAINAKKYRVDTCEKHAVEVLQGDEIFEKSNLDLEYGAINNNKLSEQAWGMFEGSTDVLVVNNKELLFSRRLLKDRENIYYSNLPAEKLQRVAHPRRTPPAFGELLFLIAFVALSIAGIIDIFVLMKPIQEPDFHRSSCTVVLLRGRSGYLSAHFVGFAQQHAFGPQHSAFIFVQFCWTTTPTTPIPPAIGPLCCA